MQTLKSRLETVAHCFEKDFRGFRLKNSKSDTMIWLMRFNLPYTVREHSSGNYLLLNREYKPLGFMAQTSGSGAQYANYDEHVLSGDQGLLDGDYYFYNDGTTPWHSAKNWKAYQERVLKFIDQLPD